MKGAKLYFGFGNQKLAPTIATFTLPAGWTCPGASDCLARANRASGKLTDGPDQEFRCYAASIEAYATTYRIRAWANLETLKAAGTVAAMAQLIEASLPFPRPGFLRMHVGGDFFSLAYMKAWIQVARDNPHTVFYGYTKAIGFWLKCRNEAPLNFRLVASLGGKFDALAIKAGLVTCEVVEDQAEATRKKLPVDHDDRHAIEATRNFAVILHGGQP